MTEPKTDIEVLIEAKETARARVVTDPNDKNLAAYERALKLVDGRQGNGDPEEPAFANRLEALKQLERLGYKIKKSKLYKDAKDGLLRLQPDGKVLEKDLDRYARLARLDKPAARSGVNIDDVLADTANATLKKLQEQIKDLELKNEVATGQHVEKALVDMEMASHIAVINAGFDQVISESLPEVIDVVNGDSTKLAEAMELVANKKAEMMNRLSEMKFEVEFGD
ncbi:hypothetical protein LCGC14_0944730 [marine sediment metagenome]|uniref:Uncharacterized protein n=1 Tax=marine sediment metagenome TaxID=412755 RepID=A0A0F9RQE4_9ZZZZ|nr:hypothetical protein [Desulfobacterales bacterium]